MLKPFFSYFGGKWRAAPRYPAPVFETIVEPFAGSAGYSIHHHERDVHLFDKSATVCHVWDFLIEATPRDVRALPLLDPGQSLDTIESLSPGARALIGFWLSKATTSPRNIMPRSTWPGRPFMFWGEAVRERIANQVPHIKHWTVHFGSWRGPWSYEKTPVDDIGPATWFVDPPYVGFEKHYRATGFDHAALARWCRKLPGQVIACGGPADQWLPFHSMGAIKSMRGRSEERVWLGGGGA